MNNRFRVFAKSIYFLCLLQLSCEKQNEAAASKGDAKTARDKVELLKAPDTGSPEQQKMVLEKALFTTPLDQETAKLRDTLWTCLKVRSDRKYLETDQAYEAWKILRGAESSTPLIQALLGYVALTSLKTSVVSVGGNGSTDIAVAAQANALLYLATGVTPEEASIPDVRSHCLALILTNAGNKEPNFPSEPDPAANLSDKSSLDSAIAEYNKGVSQFGKAYDEIFDIEFEESIKIDRKNLWENLRPDIQPDIALTNAQYNQAVSALKKYESASPLQQVAFGRMVQFRLNQDGFGVPFSQALAKRNPLHQETNRAAINLIKKGLGSEAQGLSEGDLLKKADEILIAAKPKK